jgi:hypothetical protein
MGQAKLRGDLDQRKAEAVARRAAEEQRRRDDHAAREAAMTPEQRAARLKARTAITWLVGAAVGASLSGSK